MDERNPLPLTVIEPPVAQPVAKSMYRVSYPSSFVLLMLNWTMNKLLIIPCSIYMFLNDLIIIQLM
jgi:hypothetical protein